MNVIFGDTFFESRDVLFDGQKIKEILTSIKKPEYNFEVIVKNEIICVEDRKGFHSSAGYYSRSKKEITLCLPYIKNNKELIRIAIHEYAHHLMCPNIKHKTEFWECYFELLEIAISKGLYSCNIDNCEKLKKMTLIINEYNMIKTRKLLKKESGGIFFILSTLCTENNIDFEYYCVKYLKMECYKRKNAEAAFGRYFRLNRINSEVRRDDFLQNIFSELGITWRENNWWLDGHERISHYKKEEITNLREICRGNMKNGIIYRGNDPFFSTDNKKIYYEIYSELAIYFGINCIINLSGNTKDLETIANLTPWYSTLHKSNNVIGLDIQFNFDFLNKLEYDIFNNKLRQGFKYLIAHNGPYLICSNGIETTDFVTAIIELLFGASIDEVIHDYICSKRKNFYRYHNAELMIRTFRRYIYDQINTIINGKINDSDNLQAHIEKYFIEKIGLTINALEILKEKLGNGKRSTTNNA